jgi:hypothetical protein
MPSVSPTMLQKNGLRKMERARFPASHQGFVHGSLLLAIVSTQDAGKKRPLHFEEMQRS